MKYSSIIFGISAFNFFNCALILMYTYLTKGQISSSQDLEFGISGMIWIGFISLFCGFIASFFESRRRNDVESME